MLKPTISSIEESRERGQIRQLYQAGKAHEMSDKSILLHEQKYDISSDRDFVVIKKHHAEPTPSEEHEHKFHIGIPDDRLEDAAVIAFDVSTEYDFSGTKIARHKDPADPEQSKKTITIYTTPHTDPLHTMAMLAKLENELKKAEIQPNSAGSPSYDARLKPMGHYNPPLQFTSYRTEKGDRLSHYVPKPNERFAEYYVPPLSLNKIDDRERTPLHYAAENGNTNATRQLFNAQPVPATSNVKDEQKQTPQHLAAKNGHEDIINLLLNKSADMAAVDRLKRTPLHLAAQGGHDQCVKLLIDLEVPTGSRDAEGKTPLHHAASGGSEKHMEIVKLLLDERVDVNVQDNNKKGPLDYVHDSSPIAELLKKNGAIRNTSPPSSPSGNESSSSGPSSEESSPRNESKKPLVPPLNSTPSLGP
jgi:hypothetical protein